MIKTPDDAERELALSSALDEEAILQVRGLRKWFPVREGIFSKQNASVKAVDGVSFDVYRGETLGIVGESGCGKSTTARCILRLTEPDLGEMHFMGNDVLKARPKEMKVLRRDMQIVFQDPYTSLNPRMTIDDTVAFNMVVHGYSWKESRNRAWEVMDQVGLAPAMYARRYPHELSGGQRQRVNVARALVLNPKLVLLDEPVSSLDKSVQAQVLNLLIELKETLNLTYVFISHDLNVVEYICDRVAVMYLGQVVESGPAEALYEEPLHPYTQALLASAPSGDPDRRLQTPPLSGDPPSPINPPSGCHFRTRCPYVMDRCAVEEPELLVASSLSENSGDLIYVVSAFACHLYSARQVLAVTVWSSVTCTRQMVTRVPVTLLDRRQKARNNHINSGALPL